MDELQGDAVERLKRLHERRQEIVSLRVAAAGDVAPSGRASFPYSPSHAGRRCHLVPVCRHTRIGLRPRIGTVRQEPGGPAAGWGLRDNIGLAGLAAVALAVTPHRDRLRLRGGLPHLYLARGLGGRVLRLPVGRGSPSPVRRSSRAGTRCPSRARHLISRPVLGLAVHVGELRPW